MAERGEVLASLRRLGFSGVAKREHFVVVQADALNATLATVVVVPLDEDGDGHHKSPLVVRVTAKEAGTERGQVALPHLVSAVRLDRFAEGAAGRLAPSTMGRLDLLLGRVLGIR